MDSNGDDDASSSNDYAKDNNMFIDVTYNNLEVDQSTQYVDNTYESTHYIENESTQYIDNTHESTQYVDNTHDTPVQILDGGKGGDDDTSSSSSDDADDNHISINDTTTSTQYVEKSTQYFDKSTQYVDKSTHYIEDTHDNIFFDAEDNKVMHSTQYIEDDIAKNLFTPLQHQDVRNMKQICQMAL